MATVANLLATEGALLLAEAIVGLNAVVAEPMQTTLVDNGIANHLLADRASKVLGDTTHEVLTNHVVEH